MDFRIMNFDTTPLFSTILDSDSISNTPPRHTFVRDAKAMATTPADIKEYPYAYHFIIDMPGLKSEHINVQIEEDNVLTICGDRKKEDINGDVNIKYLRMERRNGKFMRKFVLPENVDVKKIDAVCKDGVLTVIVEKLQLPEKKKRRTIQIKIE